MAWNPKGGGGPWGGGGGGQGPWGGGGNGGGQRPPGGGPPPPDIEEMLKRSQDRLRRFMPGRFGGGKMIPLIVLVVAALWMATGFYRVQPEQQGVELLFGKFVKTTSPGLNYWFPSPIGEVITPNVTRVNSVQIGFRSAEFGGRTARGADLEKESLMLTGDQNIVDLDFVVQWRIKDAGDYLFNIRNPEETVKLAAESSMREVIGQRPLDDALTQQKVQIENDTRDLLQGILDDYGSGVEIRDLKLQQADPPGAVIDAFNDVQRARQDQERFINEATAYSNDVLPRARGEAQRLIEEARAYKERVVAEAEGEAQRFLSVLNAYRGNPEVTKRRLYLERMQDILQRSDKIIIDQKDGAGSGVVPYLPLNELRKPQQTQ
jgi:membrane protease subunit HflK